MRKNEHDQPIGDDVLDWSKPSVPPRQRLHGSYTEIVPLSADAHGDELFHAFAADKTGKMWTYMPNGPFNTRASFDTWIEGAEQSTDPQFYAIIDHATGRAVGFASFLRIDPVAGVIEVGFIAMSPALQKTRMSTEAMYLMMAHVFDDLGYRRYEWKCDALNAPSRTAASRFGFTFEGIFRQATIYKGRNRDTAWFSILDSEWPQIKAGFLSWLEAANFDTDGQQINQLVVTTKGNKI